MKGILYIPWGRTQFPKKQDKRGKEHMAAKPMRRINIIGHQNPDTDSICSALAYAWLKNRACALMSAPRSKTLTSANRRALTAK